MPSSGPRRSIRSICRRFATRRWTSSSGCGPSPSSIRHSGFVRCIAAINTVVTLLAKSDMVGVLQRLTLKEPLARGLLQEIPIADAIPSVTAGIFTRADTPLTRVAAAMAKAATAVARGLARPD